MPTVRPRPVPRKRGARPRCRRDRPPASARAGLPAVSLLLGALLSPLLPVPAAAQPSPGVLSDLAEDLERTREKLLALGRAIPASEWGWRPAPGVRSVAEVLEHVAYDNFYFPTAVGTAAPDGTGITGDYATARAWGARERSREEVLDALDASFAHLEAAMLRAGEGTLGSPVTIFGREMDRQELWLMATVHAHEHLGQLIAYARMRGVVPPWSAGA